MVAEISVSGLTKEFGNGSTRMRALDDVSFEVSGGSFVAVVGPSGCGKSTLLNILSGIETQTLGELSLSSDGAPARIGYVFQSPRLLPWRTTMQNMMFVQDVQDDKARRRCADLLNMVHLGDQGDKFPGQLSGGMQQRVGIARAFSIEPDILFMDEPFSHLDALTARSLRRELHELWDATGKTVLFVTHDVDEAIELAERILVFRKGGRLADEIDVELEYPRRATDEHVAVVRSRILRRIEGLESGAA